MKKITLCLILTGFSCLLKGQSVTLDADFGAGGKLVTGLYGMSGNAYGVDFVGLPDGKIIIGGGFDTYVGLEKYDHSGVLDQSFTTSYVESDGFEVGICAQKDGKMVLVSENSIGLTTFAVRVDSMGNLDPSFGNGGIAETAISYFLAHNVFAQSDGKVIVFGDEAGLNTSAFSALRLLSNGTLDPSFALNGKLTIDLPAYAHEVPVAMLEQPDHKLIFAGFIGYPTWNILVLRINPDGTLDATFGDDGIVIDPINGNSDAYALALQPDGKILISGDTDPIYQAIIVRYNSDGTRDNSFGEQGVQYLPELNEARGIAVEPDGKILTVNWDWHWESNEPPGSVALAQLLPNGQRDASFGNNGVFKIVDPGMRPRALSLQGNKATVSARNPAGTTLKRLFRFILDLNVGTLNPEALPDPTPWVYPNPIAEQFNLEFGLPQKEQVSIQLFDLNGKLVQSFVRNQAFEQGEHDLALSCSNQMAAGNYVLTLEVAGKKMRSIQIMKK